MSDSGTDLVVDARPRRTARWANVAAAVALAAFVVTALVMRTDNAGAYFDASDQVFTVVIGLLVAAALRIPTRPRVHADARGVSARSYLGNPRFIPWELVLAVEFPSSVRFAQLRLPGDERLALYAVQRSDGEYAVATMRSLRALFAAAHDDTGSDRGAGAGGDADRARP